ncbi:MAG TPA: hypothetical protein VND65_18070 [Candidatus Binatia bacterium]|nr:hypothetical protein [Candidatus Binatia bacterium]
MTSRQLQKFLDSQSDYRRRMLDRLVAQYGTRTVNLAAKHLDDLTEKYPSGLEGLPGFCRELRARRGTSRSWTIAADMMVELLKVLADGLDQLPRRDRSRVNVIQLELPAPFRAAAQGLTRGRKNEILSS